MWLGTAKCVGLIKHQDLVELVEYIPDLRGALRQPVGLLDWSAELPNAFPWTFTRPPLWQGPHHVAVPLRLEGYKPVAPTKAFAELTIDDARCIARLISQLTERQLVAALAASGYDSAAVRLSTPRSSSAAATGWSWTSDWPMRCPRCVPVGS